MCKKKIAVIGVGNILMGDEGVGVEVVRRMERLKYLGDVELIDAGTAFLDVVLELRSFEKVIIIDAVHGGEAAGTVYRFTLDDVEGDKPAISLHDFGVIESIRLESLVADLPKEIVFYGVEPQIINIAMQLSPTVGGKVDYVVQKIIDELIASGVQVQR